MSHRRLFAVLLPCALLALSACSSEPAKPQSGPNNDPPVQGQCADGKQACTTAEDCADPGHSVCQNGCCEVTTRECESDAACCPGQTCTSVGRCTDSYIECNSDAECGSAGDRYCLDWNDPTFGVTKRCNYKPCNADGSCSEEGQTCFAGVCVASPPCGGTCGEGEACVLANNTCHPAPHCDPAVLANVPLGSLVVFTDLDNVYDACVPAELQCAAVELPPIEPADLGRHASLAIAPANGDILVSMYDGTHGDLVVRTFDVDGKVKSTDWIDGVPKDAPVLGSVNGPRGGIAEPGPDVGQYSSIATIRSGEGEGRVFVAYYGATDKSLHFITRDGTGTYAAPYVIDGGSTSGDVGRYAALALATTDGEQRPAIAYFQKTGGTETTCGEATATEVGTKRLTALKFARAKTSVPASAADWDIETVACHVLPKPPCDGCPLSCIVDDTSDNGTSCITATNDCNNACSSSQLCLDGVCRDKGSATSTVKALPEGVGLFPSLAFREGEDVPHIAWYDEQKGNLMISTIKDGAWVSKIVDGQDTSGKDTGDVGLYPSLTFDRQNNGAAVVAYYDATRRALRYLTATLSTQLAPANQQAPGNADFIDRGLGDGTTYTPPARVGADVVLLSTAEGLYAAYQDATASDLILRERQADGSWKVLDRWSEGALGFYADMDTYARALYLGSTDLKLKTLRGKPKVGHQYRLVRHVLGSAEGEEGGESGGEGGQGEGEGGQNSAEGGAQ